MRRPLCLLIFLAALLGCGSAPALKLPDEVAGWTLAAQSHPAPGTWTARFTGPAEIGLELKLMGSGTLAFSAVQSWRAEPGKLAFYRGRYFGVASSPSADHATLNRFAAALEKHIPE